MFIHLPPDGHLGLFPLWAIMNKAIGYHGFPNDSLPCVLQGIFFLFFSVQTHSAELVSPVAPLLLFQVNFVTIKK